MENLRDNLCIFVVKPAKSSLEWEVCRTKFEGKLKKHNLGATTFFLNDNRAFCNNVEKSGRAVQATDDNIILRRKGATWMRDN